MKRIFALVLALMMALAIGAYAEGGLDKGGVTNATGYPITNEPITLDVVWSYASAQDFSQMHDVFDWIEKETNIRLNLITYTEDDQVALMFAGGEYPDFAVRINASDLQRQNAVDAGDLVPLDEYIDTYCPTWKAFFEKYELTNKLTQIDGERFTLPWVNFAAYDRQLRDLQVIYEPWLNELGFEMPTTIEELTAYLRALKAAAGTGTIPENVMPLYFLSGNWVGGEFNIYSQFGVYMGGADYLVAEDGQVKYQAVNPAIKEPLKWMQQMYKEGVIPSECFTDDWSTYLTRRQSDPVQCGIHYSYGMYVDGMTCLPPVDAQNGTTPYLTSQSNVPNGYHCFYLFKDNEYPVATMRLMEFFVENVENMTNLAIGLQGEMWEYNADGKRSQIKTMYTEESKPISGVWNQFPGILADDFYANWDNNEFTDGGIRAVEFNEKLIGKTVPQEMNVVCGVLDAESSAMMSQYYTDISNCQKATFARWITTDADIDAEWDAYVAEIESYNLAGWLELKQQAYDLLH